MPFNLLKKYNDLLELTSLYPSDRIKSLKGVFNRDIANNTSFKFQNKQINPTPKDGEHPMERLFNHLTRKIVDEKTRKREFDIHRSNRLHWVLHHTEEKKKKEYLFLVLMTKMVIERTFMTPLSFMLLY